MKNQLRAKFNLNIIREFKLPVGCIISLIIIAFSVCAGTKDIRFSDTFVIFLHNILPSSWTKNIYANIEAANAVIVWQLRFPRVLLAYLTGGALAVSGSVFQSSLKNQLASPYMLGVSAGASLGAALVILFGLTIPLFGTWMLPFSGFAAGLLTVFAVTLFSAKIDKSFSNNTVILCGMVFSLFVNAVITVMMSLRSQELRTLIVWQMGSFAFKGWSHVQMMLVFLLAGLAGLSRFTRELDLLSFGELEAASAGVDTGRVKTYLFLFSTVLAGSSVALCGIVGFVDLVGPHIARRISGSVHSRLLPMSFVAGGSLMVLSDLIARTAISPAELPVGAVTALAGAPFFAYIYFKPSRRK
ncbi:MAG: iron ABC transporter permease [Spirochaetaceae bacterium]|jgi:iron complex transport system permease protein|nr:iron ABC transporter permease [Spirochaetaceae bacterium]